MKKVEMGLFDVFSDPDQRVDFFPGLSSILGSEWRGEQTGFCFL